MRDVPFIIFESELARLERVIRRQFILILVTIALLVSTNGLWLWYESQFEDVTTTETETTTHDINQDVQTDGNEDTVVNGAGDVRIDKGTTDSQDNNN